MAFRRPRHRQSGAAQRDGGSSAARVYPPFPDHLEISYPQGTLPSQEYSYSIGLDYDAELLSVLQPWAVPDGRETADSTQ